MENFEDVRKLPTGRAAVFVPELMVYSRFKEKPDSSKKSILRFDDKINQALRDLEIPGESHSEINKIIDLSYDLKDKDPYILSIAAYLKVLYPNGITGANDVNQPGKILLKNLASQIGPLIEKIPYGTSGDLSPGSERYDGKNETTLRAMVDVIDYFQIIQQYFENPY